MADNLLRSPQGQGTQNPQPDTLQGPRKQIG